eukprot:CAMPEP_0197920698 /NCGR_PEP_ID=MMETSP1439-20131203/89426_1 /TAXON_ID=66791 /ORGANISM="Gonyaulax spinifera, Strain CCMP409" /LENGTH=232 /DNA_ID=CAMNT_0043542909 /DNA_START=55 /DNA_END=750 /DNA_ORIENTATION=-
MTVGPDAFCTWAGADAADHSAAFIPYVRHTFLAVAPAQLAPPARPRARSQPQAGTCDRYAREVHVLMFKQRAVRRKEVPVQLGAADKALSSAPETASQASTPTAATLEDEENTGTDIEEEEVGPPQGVPDEQQWQQPLLEEDEEPLESIIARIPRDEEGRPTSIGVTQALVGGLQAVRLLRQRAAAVPQQRALRVLPPAALAEAPHTPLPPEEDGDAAAVEAAVAGAGAEGV